MTGPDRRVARDAAVADDAAALDDAAVAALLERHAHGVDATVADLAEAVETGPGPSRGHVDAVRTELAELASVVEDLVAADCDGVEPYERAVEHVPDDRLRAAVDDREE